MLRWLVFGVLAASVVTAGPAVGMHVRTSRTLLARSSDGRAELYEVREMGPEGGGALTYRVEGKVVRKPVDFMVSSNFSPGGSSRPQTVSAGACAERVAALGAEVGRRKILGVTLHPERCNARERDGVVEVKGAKQPTESAAP